MTPDLPPSLDATTGEDSPSADPSDDPRLMSAMREYMAALDAGKRVNRRELIGRHPEIAAELSACLQGLSFIRGAAGQLSDGGGGLATGLPVPSPVDAAGIRGTPLGDFRLLREIGRGGMGVVYEATQLSLGRQVAVKVLPMAAALDPRRLQRFRNEAQAAAGLHHTNIVPVYAVGSDRSTHFYAMQLIEGRSLAEVIRELRATESAGGGRRRSGWARRLLERPDPPVPAPPVSGTVGTDATAIDVTQQLRPPPPQNSNASGGSSVFTPSATWSGPRPTDSLSTLHLGRRAEYFRTVARLGVQAAEALDYAHGLGIVHRDIKPANLMVDARGNLWVTDFGLAQMYGDNGLTQTGDFVGTFRYMSPEQAGGGPGRPAAGRGRRRDEDGDPSGDESGDGTAPVVLDPRTDVYSLGVTLYELLTLQPAVVGRTREELLHQLAAVDPKPPRAIDRAIPVELQTVLAKAAAKDPADRYPTARALADDLRRFLADEPIHARPPTAWDHAVKWTRRHRSMALSAIIALTLSAGGLLITTLLVSAAQLRTRSAYELSTVREQEAQDARRQAQADFKLARTTLDALGTVATDDMPTSPQTAAVRQLMLGAVLDYYQRYIKAHERDAAASQPDLLRARQRWQDTLALLVATDERFRVRFDVRLLGGQSVRRDLRLSASQDAQAEQLADRVPGGPPQAADVTAAGADATDRLQASLKALLTAGQLARLAQVSRQIRGPLAFEDQDVRAVLAFTPEQAQAVRKLRAANATLGFFPPDGGGGGPPNGFEPFDGGGGGGPDDGPDGGGGDGPHGPRHGRHAGDARTLQSILALLTPKQRADWQSLTGEPFKDAGDPWSRRRHFDGPPMD